MDRLDFLNSILTRQIEWIGAADGRVALVLPLSTGMLGALAAISPGPEGWTVSAAIFSSLSAALIAVSLAACAMTTFPRVDGPKGSKIFFGGISSFERTKYQSDLLAAKEPELLDDLAAQCHVNAKIALEKFFWVKVAMGACIASAPFWVFAVYCIYQGRA